MAGFGTRRPAPPAFFLIGLLLMLWGAFGVFACAQQFRLGAEAMGPATAYDRALYAALPGWYNYAYAAAVGAQFLGGFALLLRLASARALFMLALLAVVIQFGWLFLRTDIIAVKGAAEALPFPLVITAIALFSVWYAGRARARGWIS